ncbi:MAG TPA: hypothetical protein VN709_03485 [Terriglobales bacterium]|nr:hypothetical protein [Terriglobales bacterium]
MRYWGLLAAKLLTALILVLWFWRVALWFVPAAPTGLLAGWPRFGSDLPYTLAAGVSVLVGFGLGWLCAADQVYRCRTCCRRLRMPVSEGTLSHVMLGRTPHTEYICTYGHGKLYVPEVHVSSSRAMRWTGYGSLWENLVRAENDHDGD